MRFYTTSIRLLSTPVLNPNVYIKKTSNEILKKEKNTLKSVKKSYYNMYKALIPLHKNKFR